MLHPDRVFQVVDYDDVDALIDALVQHSWTLCTAFRIGDVVLANDAFSEDGAQEYAVIRGDRQIESYTVGWSDPAHLAAFFAQPPGTPSSGV